MTNSGLNFYTEMLKAARSSRSLFCWVNDYAPGTGENVINMTGSFHNLNPGEQVVITQLSFTVITLNESVHFEIGYTSEGFCSGTFTPISPHREMTTGDAKAHKATVDVLINPSPCLEIF